MTTTDSRRHDREIDSEIGYQTGPLGRLGVWVVDHARITTAVWLLLIVGLGVFAPRVESELSGAGWQADGSDSVAARELAQEHFGGNASTSIQVVVHSTDGPVTEGVGRAGARRGDRDAGGGPPDRRGRPAATRGLPQRGRPQQPWSWRGPVRIPTGWSRVGNGAQGRL